MELNYASGGKRVLGGIIDLVVLLIFFVLCVIICGEEVSAGTYHITGIPALILFTSMFLYFVILEKIWGKTIGKMIVRTRVVNEVGAKISWGQSIVRNIIRPIDMIFVGIIGIISIASTNKKQRLGDLVARTYVTND